MVISPLNKLIYLLSGLERIDVNIPSHMEIIVLKVAFERNIPHMFENTSSFHFVILPITLIGISIAPNIFPETVFDPMVQLPNVYTLIWIGSNSLSVLLVFIPESFVFTHDTVVRPIENLYSWAMSQLLNGCFFLLKGSFFLCSCLFREYWL